MGHVCRSLVPIHGHELTLAHVVFPLILANGSNANHSEYFLDLEVRENAGLNSVFSNLGLT